MSNFDSWRLTSGEISPSMDTGDKIYHILHSRIVHNCLMILLVIDVSIVITSIILEIEVLTKDVEEYKHIIDICQSEIISTPTTSKCNEDSIYHHLYEQVQKGLFACSISILCIFIMESLCLLFAKPYVFIRDKMHVLDFLIAIVSLCLEIAFENQPEGGLLIIARMWRFARISYGVAEETRDTFRVYQKQFIQNIDNVINQDNKAVVSLCEKFTTATLPSMSDKENEAMVLLMHSLNQYIHRQTLEKGGNDTNSESKSEPFSNYSKTICKSKNASYGSYGLTESLVEVT